MASPKLLVFVGPPGAGKGTQSRLVCQYYCIPHLSTGAILRKAKAEGTELGRIVGPIMDSGGLVSDELMIQVVRERISAPDCRRGFLLDGFPRSIPQAEALERIGLEQARPLNAVIELQVPRDLLMQRLCARFDDGDNPRPEDRPDAISHRLDLYEQITAPLLGFYRARGKLLTVDGTGSPEEVFHRITEGIAGLSDILPGCQLD